MSEAHTAGVKKRDIFDHPNGQKIELSALGLRDYIQLQKRALHEYRCEIMEAVESLKEFSSDEEYAKDKREAKQKCQKLTIEMLPKKVVKVPVTVNDGAKKERRIVDQTVPYDIWWMSETPSGMLYATWLSARVCNDELTLDEIDDLFREQAEALEEAANMVGELTRPTVAIEGNGESDQGNVVNRRKDNRKARAEKRRKRREKQKSK